LLDEPNQKPLKLTRQARDAGAGQFTYRVLISKGA